MKFLQSYVCPLVRFKVKDGIAIVERCYGTGFIVEGPLSPYGGSTIITAAHVVRAGVKDSKVFGDEFGIVGKADDGFSSKDIVARIFLVEGAPDGSDVALCLSNYKTKSPLRMEFEDVDVWKDVATLGYPAEAVIGEIGNLRLNIRAQKGYVQRVLSQGDVFHYPELRGYETNLLLAEGMSGGPLFVHGTEFDKVVGVNIASVQSEALVSERVERDEAGRTQKETVMSLNRYGVAERVSHLKNWSLSFASSLNFGEIFSGENFAEVEALNPPSRFLALGSLGDLN